MKVADKLMMVWNIQFYYPFNKNKSEKWKPWIKKPVRQLIKMLELVD